MQENQQSNQAKDGPVVADDVRRQLQLQADNRRVLKLYGACKTLLVIIIILVVGAAAGKLIWGWTHGSVATETKKYYDEYKGDNTEADNQKADKPTKATTRGGTTSGADNGTPKSPQDVRQEIINEATGAK